MTNRHTEGPWDKAGNPDKGAITVVGSAQQLVALVYGNNSHTQKANADLIEASPDMLEALELQHQAIDILFAMIIDLTPRTKETFYPSKSGLPWKAVIKGNEAIAKAKGETND